MDKKPLSRRTIKQGVSFHLTLFMSSHVTSSKLNASETALCGGIAGVATRYEAFLIRILLQGLTKKNKLL